MASKSSEGTAFWWVTRIPSRTGSTQARTPGSPSTVTRQFAQAPEQHSSPRRRWYLNERENVRRPAA